MNPCSFLMLNWRDPENPLAGGAERVTLKHMVELIRRGHKVVWFSNAFEGAEPETEIDGIKIVRGGRPGTSIFHAFFYNRKYGPFDLVIDQHHGIPWLAQWWSRTRCVAYIHEVLGPIWESFYRWPTSSIGQIQEKLIHQFYCDVPFWTVSESTRVQLMQEGVVDVHVWPNGTDTEPLSELPVKPLVEPLRLVVLSRLAPNKRVSDAIRVLALLNNSGCSAELTVVGSGWERDLLDRLAGSLGQTDMVKFKEHLDDEDKNIELQNAHLLLHTSVREGWGLNVIEANAMGTPAVVYPVGGLVDSTVHGVTGLVCGEETPDSLAAEVMNLAVDPGKYHMLRQNAWSRSHEFRWEKVLPRTCNWLENLASDKI
ncbi:MAG: glycosyltransferase family 4 protein [Verrucomicrobiota bacterium]|nr:glycosyltransferase family 4 protein [Verrucomicrobiota bacterium]MEE2615868.1 glycosyltransferase family 4 protein [Verrucomicrobiota bacterium]